MSKKNKKPNPKAEISIPVPNNMTAEETKNIIVEALLAYDEAKQQQERDRKQAEHEEWQKKLGIKKFDDKPRLIRWFLNLVNFVVAVFRFLFMRKSKISGDHALTGLMRMTVGLFFGVIQIILWCTVFRLMVLYPIQSATNINFGIPDRGLLPRIELSVLAIFGAQIFRMASAEIDVMEDKHVVFDAFTAVAAILAIIVSIVLN